LPYKHFAAFYDWDYTQEFCQEMARAFYELTTEHKIEPPGPILDLACGTGSFAQVLAPTWHTVGIDCSPEMLAVAQHKNIPNAQWQQQDICTFKLEQQFPIAVCLSDSVNHLKDPEAVEDFFKRVQQHLSPDGLFWFDTNTLATYQTHWQGVDTWEGENVQLRFQSTFNPETSRAQVVIDSHHYSDEAYGYGQDTIETRYYSDDFIEKALEQAEFKHIQKKTLHWGDLEKTVWLAI
jgi:trans-aconitate methyltransferase